MSTKEEDIVKTLSPDQKDIWGYRKTGQNFAIMAPAGTGKSYLSRAMQDNTTVVVAPTGVAALNAKGITAHKAFGLPIGLPTMEDFGKVPRKMADLFGKNSPVKCIQFDELAMCRSDMLHLIDVRLQKARGNKAPFGGLQMIGIGDFYQLQPILSSSEAKHFDFKQYPSVFAFDSPAWNLKEFTLTTAHRHANPKHVELLASIRTKDENCEDSLREIIKIAKPFNPNEQVTMLCNFNQDADYYNGVFYEKINSPEKIYRAKNYGEEKYKENEMPVPENLRLKVGTKVIIKANDLAGTYVNGSTGFVKELADDHVIVTIKDANGERDVFVCENKWEKVDYIRTLNGLQKVVIGVFEQIPIKLGYSVSVHSAQGMTLEEACINTGRGSFSHGQFFVALSRVKNLENLSFSNSSAISVRDIIVRNEVIEHYKKLRGV